MRIHFRGPICRSVKAGDEVVLTGVFLPEPYTGFRAMRAGLLTNTFVEVGVHAAALYMHTRAGGWVPLRAPLARKREGLSDACTSSLCTGLLTDTSLSAV